MSGSKYLADTNAFIYLLKKHPGIKSVLQSEWVYSFITEIELLGKPGIRPAEVKAVRSMLATCTKSPHTDAISELTISLKQQYNVKTPDALIAAAALHHNLPLLTADNGFIRIKELDIVLIEL